MSEIETGSKITCKYCQKETRLSFNDKEACVVCYEWIVSTNKYFTKHYINDKIIGISRGIKYHLGKFDDLRIYFNYDSNNTFIYKKCDDGVNSKLICSFNYVLPVTQEFLDSIPKKLHLWQIYS